MSGISFGLVGFMLVVTGLMAAVCFALSFITRRFLSGLTLVVATTVLTVAVTLTVAAVGIAQSDFSLGFAAPFLSSGALVGVIWALSGRVRKAYG